MDSSAADLARIRQVARDVLGLDALRPAQQDAAAALTSGRDCLAVLPSGGGKSAIYQIAAIALGGPAIVVSPLLALQRDQADALRARGLTAVTVNALSGLGTQACACIASLQQVPSTFGNYTGLLTQPRVMQFALRYEF